MQDLLHSITFYKGIMFKFFKKLFCNDAIEKVEENIEENNKAKEILEKIVKEENKKKSNNLLLNDNQCDAEVVIKCDFEYCEEEFTVRFLKFQNVYPKYCKRHRNEYKRNYDRLKKELGKIS